MKALLLWGSLAGLLLSGCGMGADPVVANGGGGIEIPNGLRVQVVNEAGLPVQGALVRRLAGSTWAERLGRDSSVLIDSAKTGATGEATLKGAGSDAWIEIVAGGKGARLRSMDTGDVRATVAPLQALLGIWPDSLVLPRRILLSGSSRICIPGADRSFRFDSLSQGSYSLVAELPSGLRLAGSATLGGQGLQRFELSLDTSGMSIEDFEDGDILFKYSDLFGTSYWWHAASNPIGGLQAVFGISDLAKAVTAQGGNHFLSMKVSMTSMTSSSPWANFGLELGGNLVYPRMRAVRAIRMKVRGKGAWSFALSVRGPAGFELWRKDSLPLDTAWNTVRIPLDSLQQVEGTVSGKAQDVERGIAAALFQATRDAEIDVDDLVFEGLSLEDWVRLE